MIPRAVPGVTLSLPTAPKAVVVNVRHTSADVFIGRPSKWGNPFMSGSREQVIQQYARWIRTQPHLMAALPSLAGKRLGCFCAPRPCHGDVLVQLLSLDEEID